jgi:thymidine phosphorylase
LAKALVSKEVSKGCQEVSNVVQSAVEVNLRVIRGQHSRLDVMQDLFFAGASVAKKLLLEEGDARDCQAGVQAMATALSAGKVLTELERKVHKLDDDAQSSDNPVDALLRKIYKERIGG